MKDELAEQITKDMKEKLPAKRYNHTLGVAYTAASLAMCHGYDIKEAFIAGLLHDSAKYYTDDKLIEQCEMHQLAVSDVERRNPYLLHGKAGAIIAKEEYNITREEILMAISYHTTGRPGMSLLEQILFVADYIEPGRKKLPGMDEVRYLAFHDLEGCVLKILDDTITYLESQEDKEIDDTTLKTYHYYTARRKENDND